MTEENEQVPESEPQPTSPPPRLVSTVVPLIVFAVGFGILALLGYATLADPEVTFWEDTLIVRSGEPIWEDTTPIRSRIAA